MSLADRNAEEYYNTVYSHVCNVIIALGVRESHNFWRAQTQALETTLTENKKNNGQQSFLLST